MEKYQDYFNFDSFRPYFNKNHGKKLFIKSFITSAIIPLSQILAYAKIVTGHSKNLYLWNHIKLIFWSSSVATEFELSCFSAVGEILQPRIFTFQISQLHSTTFSSKNNFASCFTNCKMRTVNLKFRQLKEVTLSELYYIKSWNLVDFDISSFYNNYTVLHLWKHYFFYFLISLKLSIVNVLTALMINVSTALSSWFTSDKQVT